MTFRRTILAATALVLCVATAYAARETGRPSDRIVLPLVKPGAPGTIGHGLPVTVLTGRKFAASARSDDPAYERRITFSNLSKDKNAEFVSWYGYSLYNFSSTYYVSHSYHDHYMEVGFNAAPFAGAGRKAKKIGAPVFGYNSAYEFNLGIYSATAGGLPGSELAGGSAVANNGGTHLGQGQYIPEQSAGILLRGTMRRKQQRLRGRLGYGKHQFQRERGGLLARKGLRDV